MDNLKYILAAMIVVFVFVGPVSAEVIGRHDLEVIPVAEEVLNNILTGFQEGDYSKYARDFDDTFKESISEEKFLETRRQLENSIGNCQTKKYLGFLNKGQTTIILWKARFDQSQDDILIKLIMSKRGDKNLVTGLWFQ